MPEADVVVAAYLPEWRYEGANWDVICSHVSHLILFSLEVGRPGSKSIVALERLPRRELLDEARRAARVHGTRLMICFGGSGRSAGFSVMVRSKRLRDGFVRSLGKLLERYELDGIDYNWEGVMGSTDDSTGFEKLLEETRKALAPLDKVLTLAYAPSGREEAFLNSVAPRRVDFMHSMAYDQPTQTGQHSSIDHAKAALRRADPKMTLGLPFYGRDIHRGSQWTTYEDIVLMAQQSHSRSSSSSIHPPLASNQDNIGTLYFNGVDTIEKKVELAIDAGVSGVMIWEVGQDCRVSPVTHGTTTHPATCPHANASLLLAITRAIYRRGKKRATFFPSSSPDPARREDLRR